MVEMNDKQPSHLAKNSGKSDNFLKHSLFVTIEPDKCVTRIYQDTFFGPV